jgi:hypothetical protein
MNRASHDLFAGTRLSGDEDVTVPGATRAMCRRSAWMAALLPTRSPSTAGRAAAGSLTERSGRLRDQALDARAHVLEVERLEM